MMARAHNWGEMLSIERPGGEGGIRTLDRVVRPYNGLANRRLQPLGHLSVSGDSFRLSFFDF
jgi:hypothetical protein